jgi:nitroimidazol reductase NimA-like FMN-containing flavoprotein (pyridoxamine 5'-phosphate oxidase superfamily)
VKKGGVERMRRKLCEITDPERINKILASVNIGRLATNGSDGYPYITPVNFVYHNRRIYFHCGLQGEKLENIGRVPKVCFQVDIPLAYLDAGYTSDRNVCGLHQFYHCVIIRGEAGIVPNGPLKVEVLNALVAKHEGNHDFIPVTEDMPAYKACAVIEIIPESITAKSDLGQNKSDEERLALAEYLKTRNWNGDQATIDASGL